MDLTENSRSNVPLWFTGLSLGGHHRDSRVFLCQQWLKCTFPLDPPLQHMYPFNGHIVNTLPAFISLPSLWWSCPLGAIASWLFSLNLIRSPCKTAGLHRLETVINEGVIRWTMPVLSLCTHTSPRLDEGCMLNLTKHWRGLFKLCVESSLREKTLRTQLAVAFF